VSATAASACHNKHAHSSSTDTAGLGGEAQYSVNYAVACLLVGLDSLYTRQKKRRTKDSQFKSTTLLHTMHECSVDSDRDQLAVKRYRLSKRSWQ
jgi:hypothetical protein